MKYFLCVFFVCVDKMVFKLRHFNWILELNFRENEKTINQAQIGTGKPKICCGFAHKRIDLKKKNEKTF